MNQTILFTPIGGTDPISETNFYDGAVLHICRTYKPEKVIMYMSKEMLENQEQDDRYRYCLDLLAKMQKRKMDCEVIERRELTQVHEFDFFYQDFRTIIEQIYQKMDETDTLLLNISSGTPAMKSGLLVLQTLGEFPAKLIQVTTPQKRINEHIHNKDYDVKTLWELDPDNREDYESRCREIQCPTLSKIKKEEIIKKHIQVYDYRAALEVTDTLPVQDTKAYRNLICLASRRLQLDFVGVDKVAKHISYPCSPVKLNNERKYFEYALNMEIRLKKGEYVDFIRSITPLVVDLFELILKKQCNIDINDFSRVVQRNGMSQRRWDQNRLDLSEAGQVLEDCFGKNGGHFNAKDISSIHLKALIDHFSADDYLKELVHDIRKVEENIRNLAAHEIISVTEETIRSMTGFSSKKIMNIIKELFDYTGITIREEFWNSYDDLNREIISRMSGK